MKDFKDFKDSFSSNKIDQIINSRIDKIEEFEKDMEFNTSLDKNIWRQRSQTVGLIFDFLEEYHKWLNE